MNNRTNLPLSVQRNTNWATAVNPNPTQKAAQNALSIISRFISESRIALRDEVAAIYFPDMGLLSQMHPITRTKEGDMEYKTGASVEEQYRMHVLLRIINGKLYNHLGQLDCYAHNMATYKKNMKDAKPIGLRSCRGMETMQQVLDSMPNEAERQQLYNLLSLFAIDLQVCYTAPHWRQVVEVTQEMIDAGLTSIINDWENEKSGWTKTQLCAGDFLVLTADGMYVIRREEFLQTHSTFMI